MKIVISSKDVLDYIILSRRKNELEFKRNHLVVNGASATDSHIAAINTTIQNIDDSVAPLEEKMKLAGLKPLTLNKKELEELNREIETYSVQEVMKVASSKEGELYEKLRKRGKLAKKNFEYKEELAALTIINTMMPPLSSNELTEVVEGMKEEANLELSEDVKNKLTPIIERLGYMLKNDGNNIIIKKDKTDLVCKWVNNEKVWIEPNKADEFDENELQIEKTMNRIQYFTAKSQINENNEDEELEFKELQTEYLNRIKKREALCFYAHVEVKTQVDLVESN
ncbi:hypothetical protein KO465_08535 [Candidatus Micrarchaeota archaeon]|nr:hypothetical protein [Candidatus Micrarchaeota archaeon]